MNGYSLQPNEVVLFQGKAKYKFPEDSSDPEFAGQKAECQVLLTNLSVVVLAHVFRFFQPELFRTIEIPVDEIKTWNNQPSVNINTDGDVEIYFVRNQIRLHFDGYMEAKKFQNALIDLMTGTTTTQRTINKASELFVQGASSLFKAINNQIKTSSSQPHSSQHQSRSSHINSTQQSYLNKLQDLYEAGILTRKEYEEKCRLVLNR